MNILCLLIKVLWIGIVRCRSGSELNVANPDPDPDPDWHQKMPIFMRILPQVSHMLEIKKIFWFTFSVSFASFCLSHQCQRCHNFKYFRQYSILTFVEESIVYKIFICLALPIRIGRIRIGMPWKPILSGSGKMIRIRPDPDPDPQHCIKKYPQPLLLMFCKKYIPHIYKKFQDAYRYKHEAI